MAEQMNPLLNRQSKGRLGTVPFDQIKQEHFLPAVDFALKQGRERVAAIRESTEAPTFDSVILAMDFASELMQYVSGVFFNLLSAESDASFKAMAQEISPKLAQFSSEIMTDPVIFEKVKAIYEAEVKDRPKPQIPSDLNDRRALAACERFRLIERTYSRFIRNGAMLSPEDKQLLMTIDMELSRLGPKFSDNLLNATNAFEIHITDENELDGLPESALTAAAYLAKRKGKEGGWLFNLQPTSFMPVLTYCRNRALREKIQRAYASRAFGGEHDNRELIKRILELRHQRATLLGYQTHADYVLSDRMAESYPTAAAFLERIREIAYPKAVDEINEVKELALELDGLSELRVWDFAYYSNKLKERKYAYDPEELRPWFKAENVLEGLFVLAKRIYGIELKQVTDIPVYHPEVTTWEVYNGDGNYLGLLYLDLFPRETKRGGAWMTGFQSQGLHSDGQQRPHVAIVASLTPSTDEQPSLLKLDEVRTLFHEFGHALHGLLSDCHYKGLSGASVLWDFVELPSQIMENWLMEPEALNLFALHYQTGSPLPKELLDKVIKARNFQAANANLVQLRYGLLDFGWHTADPLQIGPVEDFEKRTIAHLQILPSEEDACISCGFAHIFAGGYSAGYYSYKWAEALEADAWSLFKERGIFDVATSNAFRRFILARGNAFHPMDLFVAFRGRKPDPDAMLKRDGLLG